MEKPFVSPAVTAVKKFEALEEGEEEGELPTK